MPFSAAVSYPPKLAVAPMLGWSDRHYRYLVRLISRNTWVYSEMIHMGAVIHGPQRQLLKFHPAEHPVALQLGGGEPRQLAAACRIVNDYGYDAVNLNCGCPSPRVQKGVFGAVLMREADRVAACLAAMQEASQAEVTVKHRLGLDYDDSYAYCRDFVGEISRKSACRTFIVHARKAWLHGVSPKDNRCLPPLRYDYVYRLKRDFPQLTIILNGGVGNNAAVAEHLTHVDGVMLGREAYRHPWLMHDWDELFFGVNAHLSKEQLVRELYAYAAAELAADKNLELKNITRHYLGLFRQEKNARLWRQLLSNPERLRHNNPELILEAAAAVGM